VLYRPDAFEPLTDEEWNERRVREAIRSIVADAENAFDPVELWPAEEWDAWGSPLPLKSLFVGAAGVVWALDALRRRGHAESRLDLAAVARHALDGWRETPDLPTDTKPPEPAAASLLCGETGILLVVWRLAPTDGLADDLFARVRQNIGNESNELMWGAPGTMLAARAMLDWTGEEHWAAAWRESADELFRRRGPEGLWTQRLFGQDSRQLGPVHGMVGNAGALLGGDLLASEKRQVIEREATDVLTRTAVVDADLANWPPGEGMDLVGKDGQIRLQWCHGAPGIVISAAAYLDEELLRAGANLTWRAGPHALDKGSGLCHGTAGNGYAFLKLFERTGEAVWLDRARRFAVHALGQVERARAHRGRGRYSLWTGDVGVALYAADCLDGRSAYPIVDTWNWA
jgi:Lanthionine synthetase C-like protein